VLYRGLQCYIEAYSVIWRRMFLNKMINYKKAGHLLVKCMNTISSERNVFHQLHGGQSFLKKLGSLVSQEILPVLQITMFTKFRHCPNPEPDLLPTDTFKINFNIIL